MAELKWDKPVPKYGTQDWEHYQYVQSVIAKRGRNYRYDDGTKLAELEAKGYLRHPDKIFFPSVGADIVKSYRNAGNYSTMLLFAGSVRGCPDVVVLYKPKKTQSQ